MTDALPFPLTPADADLRAFPFTPIFRSRLFGSSFHARVSDSEWRAGVTLWLKSWDQVPAGSLPDDDIDLCRLAELGRDTKAWKRVRNGALRGWIVCSDGRLYHPVVAEGVNEALDGKRKQQEKTLAARIGAMKKRLADAKTDDARASMTLEIESMSQTLLQLQSQKPSRSVTENVTVSVTSTNRERKGEGQGKREGEGNGKGLLLSPLGEETIVEFGNSTAPGEEPRALELELQKPPEAPPPDPKAERRAAAGRIFDHWRTTHEHERAQLDDKRLKLILKARDAGYSEADLCQAITGYLNSPHHMGENDRNTKYDSIELMLRGSKYIDQGLKFYADPPRTDRSKLMRRNLSATAGWVPPEMRNAAK